MYIQHKYASCSTSPPKTELAQRSCLSTFTTAAEYSLCAGTSSASAEPPLSAYGDPKE